MDARESGRSPLFASQDAPARLRPVEPLDEEAASRECGNCGADFGQGVACQSCQQVAGLPKGVVLASPARRLGGFLLEIVLAVVTLVVGYLVWWAMVLDKGQTPGKQVLGMRVLRLDRGGSAGVGLMLLREVVAKGLIGVLSGLTLGIANLWLLWDSQRQELWDKVAGTIVVDDRTHQLG
jgi:uncharacterized RDD family membrane protein YckC